MITLRLVHPVHRVVATREVDGDYPEEYIKQMWRYRYGKKYLECIIDAIVSEGSHIKPVIDLQTSKWFPSMKHAARGTGYSHHTVLTHCYDNLKPKNKHRRRFIFEMDTNPRG